MSVVTSELIPYSLEGEENLPLPPLSISGQDTESISGVATIAGGKVVYTYEYPREVVTDEVPLLIVPGYFGIEAGYRKLRNNVAQSGKPAITIRPVRSQSLLATFHPDYFLHPGALASQATYGVLSDVQWLYDHDTFDLVGHSLGGWTVGALATLHPGKVRSATFVASAGMEDNSTISMVKRLPGFMRHEVIPNLPKLLEDHDPATAFQFLHYLWRNPYQTCIEGVGASNCDIRPTVVQLGEAGIKTAILNFASDHLTCNKTTQNEMEGHVDFCETHPKVDLGHLAINLEPEVVGQRVREIVQKITANTQKKSR